MASTVGMVISMLPVLVQRYEEGVSDLIVYGAADVALASGVFGEEDFAGADNSFFTATHGDFDRAIEVDDVLASGGVVEAEIVVAAGFAEDETGYGDPLG